jgi:hypothetical protein
MKFPSIQAAQEWSTQHEHYIVVEIAGEDGFSCGILKVYTGGRKIFRAADCGKVYQRWIDKLTPDHEFDARLGKTK